MSNHRHEFYTGFPYHVFNRGFEKQRIFFSDADFARFTARLQFLLDEHPHIHLHAFCLLPNHFHLILSETGIQEPQDRSPSGDICLYAQARTCLHYVCQDKIQRRISSLTVF